MSEDLELKWIQVTPQRSVTGKDSWDKGVIDINWTVGGNMAWVPSKSYFRVGMKLTAGGGTSVPVVGDQLAFADSVCGNLVNNVYYRAGGQDVSSIINYASHASVLGNRMGKTGAWLENTGKVSYGLNADFNERVTEVSTGKTSDEAANESTTLLPLCTEANFDTATIAVSATGVLTGVNAILNTALAVGDQIIDTTTGIIYNMVVAATDANGTTSEISPFPAGDIAAEAKRWFKITKSNDSGARNEVYTMYQPPIGIFQEDSPQGSGDYRIQLNPSSNYKTAAIETNRAGLTPGTGTATATANKYDLEITSFEFYVAVVRQTAPQSGTETLHLMENLIQSKPVVSGENVHDFTLPPSTVAISVFMQGGTAGTDPLLPPSMFKNLTGDELKLQSIQLIYANQVKPTTRWSSAFTATKNQLTQRYVDSQTNSGMIYSPGGTESYDDWLKRGPIYHFSFERDYNDRSTQLQLQTNFTAITGAANIFVAAHYRRSVEIQTSNGYVVGVQSLST